MKTILAIGTFDVLHSGHINLFYEAQNIGKLIVGVTSDKLNSRNQKKDKLKFNEQERISFIKMLRFVESTELIDPDNGITLETIVNKHQITHIAFGSDYIGSNEKLNLANRLGLKIIFFERTKGISSTYLRNLN